MGLDIAIKERKEFRCPECGRLVTTLDIGQECSNGRVWYDFLEPIGYYVPHEKRTEENDWFKEGHGTYRRTGKTACRLCF